MPALAQDILGEELVLPAIPSWWCGEAAALPEALQQLANQEQGGVVKPTYPSEGTRQGFEPRLGRQMDQRERDEWAGRILREPEAHTVQSWLPLSHLPVWDDQARGDDALQTRPVILRVFAVTDAQGQWQVLPGGLARLGTHEGIASMQRGGSSADVWVQAPSRDAVDKASLLGSPDTGTPRQRLVTSRAAENLFWMGRYTERAENTQRLARLTLDVLGSEDQSSQRLLGWLSRMAQVHGLVPAEVPSAQQSVRVFERALVSGLWNTAGTTSVGYNLRALVRAAAPLRERLSTEHWLMLQDTESQFFDTWRSADQARPGRVPPTPLARLCLQQTSQRLAALTGFQTDRMSRDDGWRLLSMGRHIERLDFLAGALALAMEARLYREQAGFDAVLNLFDSTISFHAQYQQSRTPQALLDLLVSHPDNPRSLAWVAQTLRSRLRRMEHLADGATHALAAQLPTPPTDAAPLWPVDSATPDALMALLSQYRQAARAVAEGLSGLFFTHSGPAAHSISV